MKQILPKLKKILGYLALHPKTLILPVAGVDNDDFLEDHNTWFI